MRGLRQRQQLSAILQQPAKPVRPGGLWGFIVRVVYRYIRPLTVVYVRSIGPYAASSAQAWRQMNAWLDSHRLRRQVKQGYGFLHDNPRLTAPELLRYDACVPAGAGLDADVGSGWGARRSKAELMPCRPTWAPAQS